VSSDHEVRVRTAGRDDDEAIARVHREAFGGERVPRLVAALTAAGDVLASLVAELDGQVVGHVLLSRSWVDARERLLDVAVLSPLATDPEHQRRGVATTLVAAAIRAARDAGEPAVFLEGDRDFYGARGFSPGKSLGFERPSVRVPEPAFQVALLDPELPHGALVYCQTFWTQDCVGLRDPRLAAVEECLAASS
jgi:putative acetyltransferase